MMKAIVFPSYGPPDVLELTEIDETHSQGRWSTGKSSCRIGECGRLAYHERKTVHNAPDGRWAFKTKKNKILGSDIAGRVEASAETRSGFNQVMRYSVTRRELLRNI